jgi:hypothetical protein
VISASDALLNGADRIGPRAKFDLGRTDIGRQAVVTPAVAASAYGANNVRRLLLATIFSMIAIGQSLGAVTTITELNAKDLIDEYRAGNQQVLFCNLGVGVGIIYSNGALQADKAHQLYCGPFEFSHEQLVDLMANFVGKHPEAGKISAANVLIISLQDAFPCH